MSYLKNKTTLFSPLFLFNNEIVTLLFLDVFWWVYIGSGGLDGEGYVGMGSNWFK